MTDFWILWSPFKLSIWRCLKHLMQRYCLIFLRSRVTRHAGFKPRNASPSYTLVSESSSPTCFFGNNNNNIRPLKKTRMQNINGWRSTHTTVSSVHTLVHVHTVSLYRYLLCFSHKRLGAQLLPNIVMWRQKRRRIGTLMSSGLLAPLMCGAVTTVVGRALARSRLLGSLSCRAGITVAGSGRRTRRTVHRRWTPPTTIVKIEAMFRESKP